MVEQMLLDPFLWEIIDLIFEPNVWALVDLVLMLLLLAFI
jgi:hypothetical protein